MTDFANPEHLYRKPTRSPRANPEQWPAAKRAKKNAEARRRERLEEAFKLPPNEVLEWLIKYASRHKYGTNYHLAAANLIRSLIQDRADLNKQLEEQGTAKPKPKKTRAFGTEGNGQWDADFGEGPPEDYHK